MNVKKKSVLEALRANMGNVSAACDAVGISRKTFYQWKKEDEEFASLTEDLDDVVLDIVEGSLLEQIKGGNVTATIFYLKTKGKRRGYVEKSENEISNNVTNIIELGKGIPPAEEQKKLDLSRLTLCELQTWRAIQRVAQGSERDYFISFTDKHGSVFDTKEIEKKSGVSNDPESIRNIK